MSLVHTHTHTLHPIFTVSCSIYFNGDKFYWNDTASFVPQTADAVDIFICTAGSLLDLTVNFGTRLVCSEVRAEQGLLLYVSHGEDD